MKILLTILCGLMVLFAGGCALLGLASAAPFHLLQGSALALIPAGIAGLNILVLGALWGFAKPNRGIFITLVVLDAIVVVIFALSWSWFGLEDPGINLFAAGIIGAFTIKGLLTWVMIGES